MAIFRQYIAPFLIVLVFLIALVAVGARSFLPADMAAPAPIETVDQAIDQAMHPAIDQTTDHSTAEVVPNVAGLPPSLETLIHGVPTEASAQL